MVIEKGSKTVATILKLKNGTITKVEVNGREYALIHENQWNGRKKK